MMPSKIVCFAEHVDWSRKRGKGSSNELQKGRTLEFANNIEARCGEWSFLIRGRVGSHLSDLLAADSVHNYSCSRINFRTNKQTPQEHQTGGYLARKHKLRRP